MIAAAWVCTSTRNFNAGQVGSVRYAVWLLAPLWYIVARWLPNEAGSVGRRIAWGVAVSLTLGCIVHFRLYELPAKDLADFGGCRRLRPEVAAMARLLRYAGDPEVLAENIMGTELSTPRNFNGVYVWDMGRNTYLWLLSRKGIESAGFVRFALRDGALPRIAPSPRQAPHIESGDGTVTIHLATNAVYRAHPVLGDYILLWTEGALDEISAKAPVFANPQTMRVRTDGKLTRRK